MNTRPAYLIISIVLIALSLGLGYFLGSRQLIKLPNQTGVPAGNNAFFDSQNANVQGKVTQVTGNDITLQNQKGQSQTFPAAKTIFISKFNGTTPSVPSSDLKTIELNKDVIVSLNVEDGAYKIISVSQVPPPPPLNSTAPPPVATTLPAARASSAPASTSANPR